MPRFPTRPVPQPKVGRPLGRPWAHIASNVQRKGVKVARRQHRVEEERSVPLWRHRHARAAVKAVRGKLALGASPRKGGLAAVEHVGEIVEYCEEPIV
eukprot:2843329-Prymnesium_polylepis.2